MNISVQKKTAQRVKEKGFGLGIRLGCSEVAGYSYDRVEREAEVFLRHYREGWRILVFLILFAIFSLITAVLFPFWVVWIGLGLPLVIFGSIGFGVLMVSLGQRCVVFVRFADDIAEFSIALNKPVEMFAMDATITLKHEAKERLLELARQGISPDDAKKAFCRFINKEVFGGE